jgi:hypothetical protein
MANNVVILPRYIRVRDAPAYMSMARDVFNRDVRPYLTEIPVGIQGKAFDRLELDAWADHHKERYGRQPRKNYGDDTCGNREEKCRASASGEASGRLKSGASTHQAGGLGRARELLKEIKRKGI